MNDSPQWWLSWNDHIYGHLSANVVLIWFSRRQDIDIHMFKGEKKPVFGGRHTSSLDEWSDKE